jgi:hypothetical protein
MPLNSDSKLFLERVEALKISPPNFGELTRQALRSKFGGGGDALIQDISEDTLGNPELFAGEMSAIFGRGAVQFFSIITKFYESGKFRPPQKPTFAEQLLAQLGRPPEGVSPPKMVPFHDFRRKDEQDNYPDNAD